MWEERLKRAVRLRLLALVLAVALTWYTLNPAPGSVRSVVSEEEQPDERRREVKSRVAGFESNAMEPVMFESVSDPAVENIDDLEWPEVIEVN